MVDAHDNETITPLLVATARHRVRPARLGLGGGLLSSMMSHQPCESSATYTPYLTASR